MEVPMNRRPFITDLEEFLKPFLTLQEKASGVERLIRQHRLAEDQLPLALEIYRQTDWRYDLYHLQEYLHHSHRAVPHYNAEGVLQRVTIVSGERRTYDQ